MENNQSHGVSRRSVAKGAAWAVPAVVALGAAPKAAASVPTPPPPTFNWGAACKLPGNSGKGCGPKQSYQVPVTGNNTTANDLILVIDSFTVGTTTLAADGFCNSTGLTCTTTCKSGVGVCVPAGGSVTFTPFSGNFGSSPNSIFTVTFHWVSASDCSAVGPSTSATSPTTPPTCATAGTAAVTQAARSSSSSSTTAPSASSTPASSAPSAPASSTAAPTSTSAPAATTPAG